MWQRPDELVLDVHTEIHRYMEISGIPVSQPKSFHFDAVFRDYIPFIGHVSDLSGSTVTAMPGKWPKIEAAIECITAATQVNY